MNRYATELAGWITAVLHPEKPVALKLQSAIAPIVPHRYFDERLRVAISIPSASATPFP